MKAKLADKPATATDTNTVKPHSKVSMEIVADDVVTALLSNPKHLQRLLEHPAFTARMEKILEAYEFEVNVDEDVEKLLTPRLKTVTDITTRLNDRVSTLESAPAKKATDKKQLSLL